MKLKGRGKFHILFGKSPKKIEKKRREWQGIKTYFSHLLSERIKKRWVTMIKLMMRTKIRERKVGFDWLPEKKC